MEYCKNYVKQVVEGLGDHGHSAPVGLKLLHEQGRYMKPLTDSTLSGSMTAKQCFSNSYKMMGIQGMIYCEGFATSESLAYVPISHAWLLTPNMEVVDPTWNLPDAEYFGLAFTPVFVHKFLGQAKSYGILDNLFSLRMRPQDCEKFLLKGLYHAIP